LSCLLISVTTLLLQFTTLLSTITFGTTFIRSGRRRLTVGFINKEFSHSKYRQVIYRYRAGVFTNKARYTLGKMKISVQEYQQDLDRDNVSTEMEYLIGKLKNNGIGRCRVRSSPYCVVKHLSTHSLNNKSSFIAPSHHIVPKCSKCLSRNCCCSLKSSARGAINDSVVLLKQLLREQTLIQEAVRRLQDRTPPSNELQCDCGLDSPSPARSCAVYTSYESESESDVEI
jgi:hypothetical protein